ncbi:MBL fold metallo-hydrolase [Thermosulfuriphilus sp.]
MRLFFLGTSGSEGIPCPGCHCPSCQEARSQSAFERRPTAVLIIGLKGEALLVDAGLDVVPFVDGLSLAGVLLTHWHADHLTGLPRLSWHKRPIPFLAPPVKRPPFILKTGLRSLCPKPFEPYSLGGFKVFAYPLSHAGVPTWGYFILEEETDQRLAILWDTKGCPLQSRRFLERHRPHLALVDATYPPGKGALNHNSLDEAADLGLSLASEVFLTHISHNNWPTLMIERYLAIHYPYDPVALAYDGLKHDLSVSLRSSLRFPAPAGII